MINRALMLRDQIKKGPMFGLGGPPAGFMNEFDGAPTDMPRPFAPGMGFHQQGPSTGGMSDMNHILFVDNLPTTIEPSALHKVFADY